jgi:hypothetical protein
LESTFAHRQTGKREGSLFLTLFFLITIILLFLKDLFVKNLKFKEHRDTLCPLYSVVSCLENEVQKTGVELCARREHTIGEIMGGFCLLRQARHCWR